MTGRHRAVEDDPPDDGSPFAPPGDTTRGDLPGRPDEPARTSLFAAPDVAFTVEAEPDGPGRHARSAAVAEPPAALPAEAVAPGSVRAEAVGWSRGGRDILDGVSLDVPPGTSLAVVGPSGSGKSSLLALLAGLEQPDRGRVQRAAGDRDGLVLQGYGLVSVLSAAENVEAPLQAGRSGRLERAEIRRRAAAVLDAVGLTPVADHLVEELSGGQQQRVAIARALAVAPSVLFADELTAELDHEWKDTVVGLVLDVARRGGVVVLATHDPDLAARCDATLRLVDGRVAGPVAGPVVHPPN